MRQITVIMKPTSECNLRCRYCYHANTDYETGIMTEKVLDAIISKVQSEYNDIVYVWHGGEPLLCGLDFFRKALQLEHKYIRDPMRIRKLYPNKRYTSVQGSVTIFVWKTGFLSQFRWMDLAN